MSSPYPAGGPPSGAPGGKTSLGLDSNIGAMLCYVANLFCCAGVILSIIFLVTEKENRFVKFHALQSLFLTCALIAIAIVIRIVFAFLSLMDLGLILLGMRFILFLTFLAIKVLIEILAGIKAYGGQWFKLPLIGDLAWNMINKESNT